MKYDTWDEYKWFLLGAALVNSKFFWDAKGEINKGVITNVSSDGSVGSITLNGYNT